MKVNGTEITFITDTYADMFRRKAVIAVKKKSGRYYGDITINIPYYSLDGVGCYFFYNAKLSSIKSNQAVL